MLAFNMHHSTCMLALINMHASINIQACINIHACIQHASLNMHVCINQHACMHHSTCMHASINMHQLINPDNDNSFITVIAFSVFMKPVTYKKCAGSYGNLESTNYTLKGRMTDRSKTLYSSCVKDFSLI